MRVGSGVDKVIGRASIYWAMNGKKVDLTWVSFQEFELGESSSYTKVKAQKLGWMNY